MVRRRRKQLKQKIWRKFNYVDRKKTFTGDPDVCELYLGNLPYDLTLLECLQVFEQFGRITSMRFCIGTHRYNSNKGFGFITYHEPTVAEEAYTKLNNFEIRKGLNITVILCRLQRQIYIEKIPLRKSDKEIISQFSSNLSGIINHNIMKPSNNGAREGRQNSRVALLEFSKHCDAQNAVRLINSGTVRCWNKTLTAGWMKPNKLFKHVIMSGISDVISDRILFDWIQIASNNGLVYCNWSYGRLNLEFRTNYQAELAMRNMSGFEIDGRVFQLEWNLFPVESFHNNMY